jgi:hypothetical protein
MAVARVCVGACRGRGDARAVHMGSCSGEARAGSTCGRQLLGGGRGEILRDRRRGGAVAEAGWGRCAAPAAGAPAAVRRGPSQLCHGAPPAPHAATPAAAAAATIAGPAATPHTGRRVAANAGLYRRGGFGSGVCVGRARTGRGSVDGSWSRAPAGAGAVGASDRADTAAERPTARGGGGGGGGGPEAAIAAALRYHPRGGGGGTRRRHHHHGPCHRPVLAPGGAGRRARGCRSGCDHAKGMTACV